MIQLSGLFTRLIGAALLIAGSLVWGDRNSFPNGGQIAQRDGGRFVSLNSRSPTNLTTECNTINNDGWILLIVDLMLAADATPRTYFQTSDEPFGLFIEYDPDEAGLLRLGLGLGPEKWNTEMVIRRVRRNEPITIALGIELRQTRLITSVADRRITWPGAFVPHWRCDAVNIGDSDAAPMTALPCHQCDVSVRYATGVDRGELESLLDSYSNKRAHQWKRMLGSFAVVSGLYLLLVNRWRRRGTHELE